MVEDGHRVEGSLYWYAPNHGAPIAFAVLYLITGVLHAYQSFRYKSWRITWIYAWASLLFIAGYILRAISSWNYWYTPNNLALYIAALVLVYAAPPVYELGNYLVLGRALHYIPHLSPIHPDRTLTIFLGLSSVVEAITANGAAKAFNSKGNEKAISNGKALLKAALVLQLFVMFLQLAIAGRFHYLGRKTGIFKNNTGTSDIQNVLYTLYGSCGLITIRTLYRTVEFFLIADLHPTADVDESSVSVLVRYEWYFWFFEATLMLVNSLLLNGRHPGKYLPQNKSAYLDEQGVERDGVGFGDRRPLWQKLLDPLDLVGLVLRKDEKWWKRHGTEEGKAQQPTDGVPTEDTTRHAVTGEAGDAEQTTIRH